MPYLLILRRNQDRELGIPYEEMLERFQTWTRGLGETGVLRAVERLKPASEALTLSYHDGEVVSEGRYDAAEDVIGYYLLDAEDLPSARQHAAACPILAGGGSVEIRETDPFMPAESSS